jgi:hypothetical protein
VSDIRDPGLAILLDLDGVSFAIVKAHTARFVVKQAAPRAAARIEL